MRKFFNSAWIAIVAGCGGMSPSDDLIDCATTTGTDTFVVGLERHGAGGKLSFALMSIDPAPAARGDNAWIVRVNRLTNGAVGDLVDGATVSATPFMPSHMHFTPISAAVTPMSGGEYELRPVNLWMPGVWETTIRATADGQSDSAVYKFCIQ